MASLYDTDVNPGSGSEGESSEVDIMLKNLNSMLHNDSGETAEEKALHMITLRKILQSMGVVEGSVRAKTVKKSKTLEVISALPPTMDSLVAAFNASGMPHIGIKKLYTATSQNLKKNADNIHYYVKFSTPEQASYVAGIGEIKPSLGCYGFKFSVPKKLHPA
jgi:hypothetical protein